MSEVKKGALNNMYGETHSEETKALMSEAKKGDKHPHYGKEINPLGVCVYNHDGVLVQSFSSRATAAKWLGTSAMSVCRYVRSGKVFKGLYILKI